MNHCCILAQQPWTLLLAGTSRDMADKLSIGKVTVRVGGRDQSQGPARRGCRRLVADIRVLVVVDHRACMLSSTATSSSAWVLQGDNTVTGNSPTRSRRCVGQDTPTSDGDSMNPCTREDAATHTAQNTGQRAQA